MFEVVSSSKHLAIFNTLSSGGLLRTVQFQGPDKISEKLYPEI